MNRVANVFSCVVLILAFVMSSWVIFTRRVALAPPGVKVIRLAHWQLEPGVRDGLSILSKEFAELPEVREKYGAVQVRCEAVPESVFGPWVSTTLVSGEAPDLMEIGLGLPWPTWLSYQQRYFLPMSGILNAPNPFNLGTDLEHVALRDTLSDGGRSGYVEELQDYYRIPLARITGRVFYNKSLFERLTGMSRPPSEWREFLAVCKRIEQVRDGQNRYYVPIASSRYHMFAWLGMVADPITWRALFKADFNRDGTVGNDETYAAFRSGVLTMRSPEVRAKFDIVRELIANFQTGFVGVGRDEAVMLFAQQRAVFIATGVYDALALKAQAAGQFEVGVMRFPFPSSTDPVFGALSTGEVFDPANAGFTFGVTRFSKHPELAKDFLRFLASKRGNERLNHEIGWIPVVTGTSLPRMLQGFEPMSRGQWSCLNFELGGQTWIRFQQLFALLQTDQRYTVDRFADEFQPYFTQQGETDWADAIRDWQRRLRNDELLASSYRVEALLTPPGEANRIAWQKYRGFVARLTWPQIRQQASVQAVDGKTDRPVGPYEYLPGVLEHARELFKSRNLHPEAPAAP